MRSTWLVALIGVAVLAMPAAQCSVLISDWDGGGPVPGSTIFNQPTFSGSTSGNIDPSVNSTTITTEMAFSGTQSLKVDLLWKDADPARWCRLTPYGNASAYGRNPTIDFTKALTMRMVVASEDALAIAMTARDTGTTTEIGENGGTSGGIEFIGSETGAPPTPLPQHVITPGSWQDLTFFLPWEPVKAFAGATADGVLSSATMKGVIDSLSIRSPGTGKRVTIYIDDLRVADLAEVPEPGTMALLGLGVLPLLARRRKA